MFLLGVSSRWWIITFRGQKFPKTPILGAWIGISSQICEKNQIAISSDLFIRLTWNLTGSCGQQQRLRGWARLVVKQFQAGERPRHFENRYIAIYQRKIIRFRWNFVIHSSRFWTGWTSRDQKWKSCVGLTPSSTERISCYLNFLQNLSLFSLKLYWSRNRNVMQGKCL